jgi:hypothetical protein
MKTIIINGQRELAKLPELWYTDGTEEANEWGEAVYVAPEYFNKKYKFIGNDYYGHRNSQAFDTKQIAEEHHTYITTSEFLRLVYEPWKESQKVKLPTSYSLLCDGLIENGKVIYGRKSDYAVHIDACIQLTNIMNFANDAFEGDDYVCVVDATGEVCHIVPEWVDHPIRFTSKAAAEWAYKTFPEIFKAYWNV